MDPMMMKRMLMAPEGDGGGGGTTTGTNGAGSNGAGGDPPVVFTEAQQKEMVRLQNAAMSAHHTRMQKVFDSKLEEVKEGILGSVKELLQPPPKKDTPPVGKDGQPDPVAQVRQEYEARIAEVERRATESEKKRQEEHAKAQQAEERSKLGTALRGAGINEGLLRSAQALLYTEDKRVGRDKDGNVVFKMQREGYVEDMDLAAGLEEWLKTAEGKHFAPARGAAGSGAEGGRAGGSKPGEKKSIQEKKRDLVRAILSAERGGG